MSGVGWMGTNYTNFMNYGLRNNPNFLTACDGFCSCRSEYVSIDACRWHFVLGPLTSLFPLPPAGNLLVSLHAICISHGGGLGRLSNRGEIPRGEDISQRVRGVHRDGTIYNKPKWNEWTANYIGKIIVNPIDWPTDWLTDRQTDWPRMADSLNMGDYLLKPVLRTINESDRNKLKRCVEVR